MTKKINYCVLPFKSISIDALGQIRQCCNAGNSDGNAYIKEVDVNGIINNVFIKNIRQSFLEDKQHLLCERCWKQEAIGSTSFRHNANNNRDYGIKNKPIVTKKDISYSDIEYIDITLGNKCNLACRMCNWSSSSLLARQLKDLGQHDGPVDLEFDEESQKKILNLISRCKNLNTIYMLGGEPLINPLNDQILDLLIKTGQSRQITIHYNTNLQINQIENYLEKWSYFKAVDIQASIDGCNEVYNYIRWPGKWKKVFKNMHIAAEMSNDSNFKFSIATTIQNINAHNIPDLITMCESMHNKAIPFFFIPVMGTMTLELTPKYILKEAIEKLESMPNRPWIPLNDLLANYYAAYKSEIDKHKLEEFFEQQRLFDIKRKQNLFETIPHFRTLADEFSIGVW